MTTNTSRARKRLALDEPEHESTGKIITMRKEKNQLLEWKKLNSKVKIQTGFEPKFERPITRSRNGIEVPKRLIDAEEGNTANIDKKIRKVQIKEKDKSGRHLPSVVTDEVQSKSNNNATSLVNPDHHNMF